EHFSHFGYKGLVEILPGVILFEIRIHSWKRRRHGSPSHLHGPCGFVTGFIVPRDGFRLPVQKKSKPDVTAACRAPRRTGRTPPPRAARARRRNRSPAPTPHSAQPASCPGPGAASPPQRTSGSRHILVAPPAASGSGRCRSTTASAGP